MQDNFHIAQAFQQSSVCEAPEWGGLQASELGATSAAELGIDKSSSSGLVHSCALQEFQERPKPIRAQVNAGRLWATSSDACRARL